MARALPLVLVLSLLSPVFSGRTVLASDTEQATDEATARGRQAYLRGVQLAHEEEWGSALAAFEEAATARDAPLIEFNIAYCKRALGRYVTSRETFQEVLADPAGLAPSQIEEAQTYLTELDQLIARVAVQMDPPSATLTVDGRPLAPGEESDTYFAGLAPSGSGSPIGKAAFTVVLDPGAHVFRAVREGHQDAVILRTYRPGESARLDLHLDVLPATISVHSEPAAAIVRVDSREVGMAPIEFQRMAGRYSLEVVLDKHEPYKASLDLAPGQRTDLTARLNPYQEPLTKKWWFWTAAGLALAGGAALTYAVTRSTPQPPPYDEGSAGWLVHAPASR
jgi:hypothetical protein